VILVSGVTSVLRSIVAPYGRAVASEQSLSNLQPNIGPNTVALGLN
jgi:hypothetical protein